MNPFSVLKRVSFKHILKGILLGMGRPLFIFPTIKATKDCIKISTSHYGKLHHKNGPANAFRHALWNYLIAKKCLKWNNKEPLVYDWAKKVTDWHEEAFPNKPLAKAMDLHNNAVGRFIFKEHIEKSEEEIITVLQKMTLESVKIEGDTDLSKFKDRLVHILEP
ncbi:hypothetical protein SAMN04487891_101650 [Flagellimonas taeanensis]|uniref:DUF6973 domain-containing protein n=2 Tax=Flagellimonas taeanensis TaxID=1005926 RepID=A0A1M6QMH9_9FLAO|nr:hypothetical protein SAMN04487891_101650 [Allomuricauda taeanensis]SHK21462.1 hypothetical protein SAMN05216293_0659 [Allomuricauda taeanensis]